MENSVTRLDRILGLAQDTQVKVDVELEPGSRIEVSYDLSVLTESEYLLGMNYVTNPKEPVLTSAAKKSIPKKYWDNHYKLEELMTAADIYKKLDYYSTRGLDLDNLTVSEQYLYERLKCWADVLGIRMERAPMNPLQTYRLGECLGASLLEHELNCYMNINTEWRWWRQRDEWLHTTEGKSWLASGEGQHWLTTSDGACWMQWQQMRSWLRSSEGQAWLITKAGKMWVQGFYEPLTLQWLDHQSKK